MDAADLSYFGDASKDVIVIFVAMMRTRQGQLKPVLVVGVDDSAMVGATIQHRVLGDVSNLARPNAVIIDQPGQQMDVFIRARSPVDAHAARLPASGTHAQMH
jgi:hypothetical protein